jgi:hypothetical protein
MTLHLATLSARTVSSLMILATRTGLLTWMPAIALTQTVTLRGEQVTISGNGELVRTCDSGSGRYCTGSNRINVSTAVA